MLRLQCIRLKQASGTWRRRAALLILPWVSITATAQAAQTIRFAPERDYAPFVFESADGEIRGLSVDMLDALRPLLRSVNIQTQPAQPLAQIMEAARHGEVDLISSLRPTAERSRYLAFTPPYVQVPAVLVVQQSISPARLRDLTGQRVAVGQGYAVEPFVREAYPQVQWHSVPDDLTALRGLLQGQYQGVVADIASVTHAVRERGIRGVQVTETVGFDYALGFAYRKELVQFGQQLQAAMQQLEPQQRQRIMARWIDDDTLRFEDPRRVLLRRIALGVALAAGLLLLWAHWRRPRNTSP